MSALRITLAVLCFIAAFVGWIVAAFCNDNVEAPSGSLMPGSWFNYLPSFLLAAGGIALLI